MTRYTRQTPTGIEHGEIVIDIMGHREYRADPEVHEQWLSEDIIEGINRELGLDCSPLAEQSREGDMSKWRKMMVLAFRFQGMPETFAKYVDPRDADTAQYMADEFQRNIPHKGLETGVRDNRVTNYFDRIRKRLVGEDLVNFLLDSEEAFMEMQVIGMIGENETKRYLADVGEIATRTVVSEDDFLVVHPSGAKRL